MAKGKSLHDMSLAEMDVFWDEAKKLEAPSLPITMTLPNYFAMIFCY